MTDTKKPSSRRSKERSIEETKDIQTYSPPTCIEDFDENIRDICGEYEWIRKGKDGSLLNVPSVFDIEATSFYDNKEKRCCMYAWVFGINGRCIRGRTWDEFILVTKYLKMLYDLSPKRRLVVYVHNLSYEFQWFRKHFEWEKIFAVDDRKPLYAITKDGIEFRCSYLLSGYSLQVLGENLTKYKVNKMVGDLDYNLLRHSATPLTKKEWGYILNDGLVVMAHIQEEIERLGNIVKLPLTKTGYVRNLCRDRCLKGSEKFEYNSRIRSLTLDTEQYLQVRSVYTGGFTHANYNYANRTIHNVHSFDFSSSYPAIFLSEYFPSSPPHFALIKDADDFSKYLRCFCCCFDCVFHNIRSKVSFDNYISVSRCKHIEHYIMNNGRVIEADILKIGLTEQDFFIIYEMYEWDYIEISNFYYFYKAYLPKPLIETVLDLYRDKTELKGVEEKIVEYLVSKGMINALYGMCVTDICRDEIVYENNTWGNKKADFDEMIDKNNRSNNRFLYYPWGVWITAYARKNLFTGILEFRDDYVYSDTDSIKVVNIDKHEKYIKEYNEQITKKVHNCLNYYGIDVERSCPKTIKGIPKPIGVWDYEGVYDSFKTLGAKRYITEQNGDISITVAGVNKRAGARYLKHKFGSIENIFNNFTDNLTFPAYYTNGKDEENGSGKLCHTYLDTEMEGEIIDYLGNKYHYKELSGVHMENTSYTMSLDAEYRNLLKGIKGTHIV